MLCCLAARRVAAAGKCPHCPFQYFCAEERSTKAHPTWETVCGTLVSTAGFRKFQSLLSERPQLQAPIAAVLPRAVQRAVQRAASSEAGSSVVPSSSVAGIAFQAVYIVGAPCLSHGLRQLLRSAASERDSPGDTLLTALADLISLLPEHCTGRAPPAKFLVPLPFQAVQAWGSVCSALGAAEGQAPPALQQWAGELSLRLLPALAQLAAAALETCPWAAAQLFSSLHDVVKRAGDAQSTHGHMAGPSLSSAVAACAVGGGGAALQLVHLALAKLAEHAAAADAAARMADACMALAEQRFSSVLLRGQRLPSALAKVVWQAHTAACRLVHAATAQPAAAAALSAQHSRSMWSRFGEVAGSILLVMSAVADAPEPGGAAAAAAAGDAATVAHADAWAAVLMGLEQRSIELPAEEESALRFVAVWQIAQALAHSVRLGPASDLAAASNEAALDALQCALPTAMPALTSREGGELEVVTECWRHVADMLLAACRQACTGARGSSQLSLPEADLAAAE